MFQQSKKVGKNFLCLQTQAQTLLFAWIVKKKGKLLFKINPGPRYGVWELPELLCLGVLYSNHLACATHMDHPKTES